MSDLKILHVVDSSTLVHIGCSVGRSKNFKAGNYPTGGMYELLRLFTRKDVKLTDTWAFCFDRRSFRKQLDTTYKSNRDFKPVVLSSCKELEKGLEDAGFNVFHAEGIEADDFIYTIVKKYYNDFDYIKIYTTDRDSAILVDDKVELTSPSSLVPTLSKGNFTTAYSSKVKLPYNSTLFYKIAVKDVSDNTTSAFDLVDFYKLVQIANREGLATEDMSNPDILLPFLDTNPTMQLILSKISDEKRARFELCRKIIPPVIVPEVELKPLNLNETAWFNFLNTFRMNSIMKKFGYTMTTKYNWSYLNSLSESLKTNEGVSIETSTNLSNQIDALNDTNLGF